MKKDKIPIIEEKLQYLLTESFKEYRFNVLEMNVEIDEYDKKYDDNIEIISYNVFSKVDYQGPINGWDYPMFSNDLRKSLESSYLAMLTFSIEQDGSIIKGSENVHIDGPVIINMNYIVDELHEFLLSFKVTYSD
jgi:hypothetical protein